jgi:hypothetical protein
MMILSSLVILSQLVYCDLCAPGKSPLLYITLTLQTSFFTHTQSPLTHTQLQNYITFIHTTFTIALAHIKPTYSSLRNTLRTHLIYCFNAIRLLQLLLVTCPVNLCTPRSHNVQAMTPTSNYVIVNNQKNARITKVHPCRPGGLLWLCFIQLTHHSAVNVILRLHTYALPHNCITHTFAHGNNNNIFAQGNKHICPSYTTLNQSQTRLFVSAHTMPDKYDKHAQLKLRAPSGLCAPGSFLVENLRSHALSVRLQQEIPLLFTPKSNG